MSGINVICRNDVSIEDKSLPCIAVDAGLFYCLENDLDIMIAIGDFDSLDPEILLSYQGEVIKANREKDQSDLELALDYLKDTNDEIYVYGALGGRMDHCLVNLKLCYYTELDLRLIDKQNLIYRLRPGTHQLTKRADYVSFIAFEDCNISLEGFKYPLDDYHLKVSDNITLSNEIVRETANIKVDKRLLVLFTRDDDGRPE